MYWWVEKKPMVGRLKPPCRGFRQWSGNLKLDVLCCGGRGGMNIKTKSSSLAVRYDNKLTINGTYTFILFVNMKLLWWIVTRQLHSSKYGWTISVADNAWQVYTETVRQQSASNRSDIDQMYFSLVTHLSQKKKYWNIFKVFYHVFKILLKTLFEQSI